jgi:hypothetical protein
MTRARLLALAVLALLALVATVSVWTPPTWEAPSYHGLWW